MHTKCWTFENISFFLKCLVCLKICLFLKMDCEQATKNFLPTQKYFVHFSLLLTLLSYYSLLRSLIFGCKGTGVGHHIVKKCNVVRYLSIFIKGLRSFVKANLKGHRGTMILYLSFIAKVSHMRNMAIFIRV